LAAWALCYNRQCWTPPKREGFPSGEEKAMQAKKWLPLGVFLSMGPGCTGSFATDSLPVDCRVSGCPPGEHCKQTPGGGAGCEKEPFVEKEEEADEDKKEDEGNTGAAGCHSDNNCNLGHICMKLSPWAQGQCQEGCRVGDKHCPAWQSCVGLGGDKASGAPGRCEGEPNCHVGEGSCEKGEVCGISGDSLWALGICRPETTGKPCEEDPDCSFGTVCAPLGGIKQCTLGERHPEGGMAATLQSFQLLQGSPSKVIAPFRINQGAPNPHAGWVDRELFAIIHVAIQGPKANEDFKLQRNQVPTSCTRVPGLCEAERCEWTCPLLRPWTGATVEFRLTLGGEGGQSHRWSYLLDSPAEGGF